ncbi:hypothetical protein RRG08_030880 [Elysia crispata]|uniref:Uncharacterized protein n=1 Tax=Elysia crispata TaxID=231223 RepID=A0AAE0XSX0_9GAST|nr:hypothetical protein RRG08_030880 [Elysia crispata]
MSQNDHYATSQSEDDEQFFYSFQAEQAGLLVTNYCVRSMKLMALGGCPVRKVVRSIHTNTLITDKCSQVLVLVDTVVISWGKRRRAQREIEGETQTAKSRLRETSQRLGRSARCHCDSIKSVQDCAMAEDGGADLITRSCSRQQNDRHTHRPADSSSSSEPKKNENRGSLACRRLT